jgi:hypothetical protein
MMRWDFAKHRLLIMMLVIVPIGILVFLGSTGVWTQMRQDSQTVRAKGANYRAEMQKLLLAGARLEEVSGLLGAGSEIPTNVAHKIMQGFSPIKDATKQSSDAASPVSYYFCDGDFVFVVFFDAEGRLVDFFMSNQ